MTINLKELSKKEERLASGHRLCAGCAEPIIVRQILLAIDEPVVIANATGCLEVATTIYPYTSWKVPWIHSAFENAAATISGVEAAYRVLKRKGTVKDTIRFIAFAGDGGTYDIGIQSLSGAAERGHDFLYVCLNNEAYMNTGIQRSSATPKGAVTTTSPCGDEIPGKKEYSKDLTGIMAAHKIPYVAQVSPGYHIDLMEKVQRAMSHYGPKFINAIAVCPRGWRAENDKAITNSKLAVDTCIWPLYEVEEREWRLTSASKSIAEGKKEKKPVDEYFKQQARFKHLFGDKFADLLPEIQEKTDQDWEELKKNCGY
jgi:pyruvate ferredoxin oxidoreductase beta subunit